MMKFFNGAISLEAEGQCGATGGPLRMDEP